MPVSRRGFLGAGALAATPVSSETVPDFQVDDQQPFRGQTRRMKITNHGRYVTSLIFSADYPTHFRLKPELHPVLTPAGVPVTDSHAYCFIHHQSVMCGHGRVRVGDRVLDFYRKLNFPEEARGDRWHSEDRNLYHLGPSGIQRITEAKWTTGESVSIDLTLEWQTREFDSESGETILVERRRYGIRQDGPHTIIDHFTHLVPANGEAVLEADRHSFCGVRVNDLIDVEDGGTMRDSEGRQNPDGDYWDADGERKAPRWVDCTGKIGGTVAGIALMGHPENLRNQYYVRHYGLMEVSAMLGEDVRISGSDPFRFAARHVAHDGELKAETANALFDDFGSTAELE